MMWKKQKNNRISSRLTAQNCQISQSLQNNHSTTAGSRLTKTDSIQIQNAATSKINEQSDKILPDDIQLEMEEMNQQLLEADREKKWSFLTRIVNIMLIVACVYFVFLIYGVAVTDYQYTDDGTISAQRLSVSDIRNKKDFETVLVQYESCRLLYEQVLMIDYRLGQGEEDPLIIGPEYEELLDTVSNLSIKTEAATVDTQYTQIKNMLLSWIKNDIAVYLQNMSSSISQNNIETANNALQDKDRVYANFSQITSNIVSLGEQVPGVDLTVIKEWTPESYVDKKIKGE